MTFYGDMDEELAHIGGGKKWLTDSAHPMEKDFFFRDKQRWVGIKQCYNTEDELIGIGFIWAWDRTPIETYPVDDEEPSFDSDDNYIEELPDIDDSDSMRATDKTRLSMMSSSSKTPTK